MKVRSRGPYDKVKKNIYNEFNAAILAGVYPLWRPMLMPFDGALAIRSRSGFGRTRKPVKFPIKKNRKLKV